MYSCIHILFMYLCISQIFTYTYYNYIGYKGKLYVFFINRMNNRKMQIYIFIRH